MGLAVTASPLTAADVCVEAFEAARQINSEWALSRALRGMARHLPPACVPDALALTRAMRTPSLRGRTLMALALAAPESDRLALLAEADACLRLMTSPADMVAPLSALAGYLGGEAGAEAAGRALRLMSNLRDDYELGWSIAGLAPYLSPDARLEALDLLRGLADDGARASALAELSAHLPETVEDAVLDEAIATARALDDDETRARALAEMLERLPEPDRPAVALEALAAAALTGEAMPWARVLRAAAPHLPSGDVARAVDQALGVLPADARAEALIALLPVASPDQRTPLAGNALDAAAQVGDEWTRATLISRIAGYLTASQLARALDLARALRDPWARADLLGDLAAAMPHSESAPVLAEALAAARSASSPWVRARALTGVAANWETGR